MGRRTNSPELIDIEKSLINFPESCTGSPFKEILNSLKKVNGNPALTSNGFFSNSPINRLSPTVAFRPSFSPLVDTSHITSNAVTSQEKN